MTSESCANRERGAADSEESRQNTSTNILLSVKKSWRYTTVPVRHSLSLKPRG